LQKCAKVGKKRHTRKKPAYLRKYGTLEKRWHSWKNAGQLKNAAHLEKFCTLGKMQHTWKGAPLFGK